MQMLKCCLNWKVIAGLAAVGVGIYVVAPGLVAAALPILLLAICPLSMLFMMKSMQHNGGEAGEEATSREAGLTREEQLDRLRAQQAALAGEINALKQEEPQAAKNGRRG